MKRYQLCSFSLAILLLYSGGSAGQTDLDRVIVTGSRPSFGDLWTISGGGDGRTNYLSELMEPEKNIAETAKSDETVKDAGCTKDSPVPVTGGNPVVLATGNKIEEELDFTSAGEMALFLSRTYNHHWEGRGIFGKYWLSNLDYSLVEEQVAGAGSVLWVQKPDGRRLKLVASKFSEWEPDSWDQEDWLTKGSLVRVERLADGTYLLQDEVGGKERYSSAGKILELINSHGVKWSFSYDGLERLQRVTHSSGRAIQFFWTNFEVTKVHDPAGNEYIYSYSPGVFEYTGRLSSATLPGVPVTQVQYHYEDSRFPGGLTGKSYNGVRYSSFAYDNVGRGIVTEHAGGVERNTFSYKVVEVEQVPLSPPQNPAGGSFEEDQRRCSWGVGGRVCSSISFTTQAAVVKYRATRLEVTHITPNGRLSVHTFADAKPISSSGRAGNCPASYAEISYDENGHTQTTLNFNGVHTAYVNDPLGRILRKAEALGKAEERVSTFVRDPYTNLVTSTSVLGLLKTDFTYDANRRLLSITESSLVSGVPADPRVTNISYTLHPNGLVATQTVNGPLAGDSDRVVSSVDAIGNLTKTTDGLGHAITYSGHNGLGLPSRVVGANGEATEYVYDARGRVQVRRVISGGIPRETKYSYTPPGRLASVTTPDDLTTQNFYDAAGRLIKTTSPESANVFIHRSYTYDVGSNITEIKVTRDTPPVPQAPPVVIGSSFAVKWIAQPGAVRYVLQESKDGGAWADVYSGSSLEWSASGRPPGSYSYRIVACTADGQCSRAYISEEPVVVKPDLSPIINYLLNS